MKDLEFIFKFCHAGIQAGDDNKINRRYSEPSAGQVFL
jgi:hypothetical protein